MTLSRKLRNYFSSTDTFLNKQTCAVMVNFIKAQIIEEMNLLAIRYSENSFPTGIIIDRIVTLKQEAGIELDETEYLMSTEANRKHLDKAIQSTITPEKLLKLGFKEEYQQPDMGEKGYIYYSLYLHDVCLLSTSTDEEFYVFMDDDTKITNLDKLSNLVYSLKDLSDGAK